MNKYQACVRYHEANGFLPAKHAEEFEENKEALIVYIQTCALNNMTKSIKQEVINQLDNDVIDHMISCLEGDSDDLEEVIQILTNKAERDEVNRWYEYN